MMGADITYLESLLQTRHNGGRIVSLSSREHQPASWDPQMLAVHVAILRHKGMYVQFL